MYFQFFQSVYLRYAAWQSSTFSVKNSCRIPITLLVILKKNIISNFSHLLGNISFRQYVLQNSSGILIWKADDFIEFQWNILVIITRMHYVLTNNAFRQYQLTEIFLAEFLRYSNLKSRWLCLMYLLVFQSAYLLMQLAWLSWLRLWSLSRESLPHQRTWATTK